MKKTLITVALCTLAAAASAQDTKVAIGISGWTGFAPLTLAKEAGLFKKHGLDVSIKKIPQKDRHLAIASGDIQCAATTVETWVVWSLSIGAFQGALQPVVVEFVARAAATLSTLVQPTTIVAGQPVAPAVQVRALDAFGNTATGFVGLVGIEAASGPGAGLVGGTPIAAAAGVASFPTLSMTKAASQVALLVSSPGLARPSQQTGLTLWPLPRPPCSRTSTLLAPASSLGAAGRLSSASRWWTRRESHPGHRCGAVCGRGWRASPAGRWRHRLHGHVHRRADLHHVWNQDSDCGCCRAAARRARVLAGPPSPGNATVVVRLRCSAAHCPGKKPWFRTP